MTDYERAQLLLDGWKQAVDVQMHFNDIEMRIRNMAITVVGALVGAGAFGGVTDRGVNPILLGSVALVAWLAFYFMDRLWYHRLLMGAVNQGARIEKALSDLIPEIDLTNAISETSPVTVFGWEMHSKQKMDSFYVSIAIAIVIATLLVSLGTKPEQRRHSVDLPGATQVESEVQGSSVSIGSEPPASASDQPSEPETTNSSGSSAETTEEDGQIADDQLGDEPN